MTTIQALHSGGVRTRCQPGQPVRIGVVGLGVMGANHARTITTLDDLELVGLYDRKQDLYARQAREYGVPMVADRLDLLDQVDAVVIAVTSSDHAEVALPFLEKGIPCLIEKPLAPTPQDCQRIIAAAERYDTPVMVGHIECFNPAVRALSARIGEFGAIRNFSAERLGINTGRVTDIDVVMDLMVHDLSVFYALMPDVALKAVNAGAPAAIGPAGPEQVSALMAFDNGVTATVVANRMANTRKRILEIFTEQAFVELDYIARTVTVRRLAASPAEFEDHVLRVGEGLPLDSELSHFADVVRGQAKPMIGTREAMAVMEWAWQVQDAASR